MLASRSTQSHHSGPDMALYLPGSSTRTVVDGTVLDLQCASYTGKKLAQLFAERGARKNALYKSIVESSRAELVCAAISAQGQLG